VPVIHERYKNFVAPHWVRPTVERLLASLPPEHTAGLESVVLTDGASVGKGKTRRVGKRKYHRAQCLGFYHPASRTSRPWIELLVDNITPKFPPWFLWFQFVRDVNVSDTLFHEIGHHLDYTVGAATRQGERAADDWCLRLKRIHFRTRYRRVIPLAKLLAPLVRGIRKLIRRTPKNGMQS
jgi:hypothetical protein